MIQFDGSHIFQMGWWKNHQLEKIHWWKEGFLGNMYLDETWRLMCMIVCSCDRRRLHMEWVYGWKWLSSDVWIKMEWTDGRKMSKADSSKKCYFLQFATKPRYQLTNSKLLVWVPVVWDSNRGTPKEHSLSKRPTQTTAASLLEDSEKQPLLRWCRIWPSYLHGWDMLLYFVVAQLTEDASSSTRRPETSN